MRVQGVQRPTFRRGGMDLISQHGKICNFSVRNLIGAGGRTIHQFQGTANRGKI